MKTKIPDFVPVQTYNLHTQVLELIYNTDF